MLSATNIIAKYNNILITPTCPSYQRCCSFVCSNLFLTDELWRGCDVQVVDMIISQAQGGGFSSMSGNRNQSSKENKFVELAR
jgi:hypothetical protein